MVCIHCGHKTQVRNSRPARRTNQVWRRRHCLACGAIFTTQEQADYGGSWLVRGIEGDVQPFSRDKLFLSLYSSLQHRSTALADASGLVETVIKKTSAMVKDSVVPSKTIIQIALVALHRFDKAAGVHYQAFHTLARPKQNLS